MATGGSWPPRPRRLDCHGALPLQENSETEIPGTFQFAGRHVRSVRSRMVVVRFGVYAAVSTLGAVIINVAINAVVAWFMYVDSDVAADPDLAASVFAWPRTVAGDVVVTCFVTGAAQSIISGQMILGDLDPAKKSGPFTIVQASRPSATPQKLQPLRAALEKVAQGDGARAAILRLIRSAIAGALLGGAMLLGVGIPALVVAWAATDDEWSQESLTTFKALLGATLGAVSHIVLLAALGALPVAAEDDTRLKA